MSSTSTRSTSTSTSTSTSKTTPFTASLLAGAVAGTSVDLSLYPIDTLKTRLQSAKGFTAAGGFRGIYAGVGSAALGAAPGAALFFVTYEGVKDLMRERRAGRSHVERGERMDGNEAAASAATAPGVHMLAAAMGEVAACAFRVPTEVVKQRAQAKEYASSLEALKAILSQRGSIGLMGVWRELYRGWNVTVMREVPFTIIQFPLWEALKTWRQKATHQTSVSALDSAVFGSVSGAVAAGLTTPLDVLKTRLMLSREKVGTVTMLKQILNESGPRAFFAGIGPRILWISAGGFVFLGSYQFTYNALSPNTVP